MNLNDKSKVSVTPFNKDFCAKLEIQINNKIQNSKEIELKGFWCDGILWKPSIENQLSKKYINDNRKLETKAWIGKEGQTEYLATIYFGKKSLSKYAKGLSLTHCIPNENINNWIEINIYDKSINIKLD